MAALVIATWDTATFLEKQRQDYQRAAESYAQQADQRIDSECRPDAGWVAYRSCIRQILEAQEDQKRAERDLDAQETMALFTRIMGITGVVGLIVGLGSVYLIWATLRETRKIAVDTREIGEAQVRAYLSVEKVTATPSINGGSEDVVWKVCVTLKNTGQSPAQKVAVMVQGPMLRHLELGIPPDIAQGATENATALCTHSYQETDLNRTGYMIDMIVEVKVYYHTVFKSSGVQSDAFYFKGAAAFVDGEKSSLFLTGDVGPYQRSRKK